MYCSNCGKSLVKNDKFCSHCGFKINKDTTIESVFEINQEDPIKLNTINENDKKPKTEEHKNYILRHWYGEVSLGISYWINYVGLNILFTILTLIIVEKLDFETYPYIASFSIIIFWLFLVVLFIWMIVGLWRSASNHTKKYNKYFWAIVVKFLIVIGCIRFIAEFIQVGLPQIQEFSKIIVGKDSIPKYNINILNNNTELEISGGIKFGLTNDVEKYFVRYPNIKVIHLNSIGGRITEAHKLYKFLKPKKLTTYVSKNCQSACTDVYLSGNYRVLRKGAFLGFHAPTFAGMSQEDLQDTIYDEKKLFLNNGIKRSFVNKIFTTPNDDMWIPSNYELIEAGIVHKIIDGDNLAATHLYTYAGVKKLESILLDIAVYQKIKKHEPNEFKKISQIINETAKKGETYNDMILKTRAIAHRVFIKYIEFASPEIQDKLLDLMIEQYEVLYYKDINAFYDYAMLGRHLNIQKYFSKSLRKKELNLMAMVIDSGSKKLYSLQNINNIESTLDKIYLKLYYEYQDDYFLLNKKNPTKIEKKKIGEIALKIFKEIKKLDLNTRAEITRYILLNR